MHLRSPRVNRKVRTAVSVGVVAVFLGVYLWKLYTGQPVRAVTYGVVVAFAIAAGYGIWGNLFGKAVEDAKEMTGQESSDDGGDEDTEGT